MKHVTQEPECIFHI